MNEFFRMICVFLICILHRSTVVKYCSEHFTRSCNLIKQVECELIKNLSDYRHKEISSGFLLKHYVYCYQRLIREIAWLGAQRPSPNRETLYCYGRASNCVIFKTDIFCMPPAAYDFLSCFNFSIAVRAQRVYVFFALFSFIYKT